MKPEIQENTADANRVGSTGGSAVERKAFVCKQCGCVYADEPVTECDCHVGGLHAFYEGVILYVEQPNNPREPDAQN